jgi:hypothetical protein
MKPLTPSTWSLALASLLALAPVASADAPKPYAVGDTVQDFAARDVDGKDVSLAALRAISPEQAMEAAKAAAAAFGGKDAKAETAIDDLAGVKKDGAVDPALRLAYLKAAGRPFGLVACPKVSDGVKTLADVAKWITDSAGGPLVLVVWSAKCPMVKLYAARLSALLADTGARVLPLAANVTENDDEIKEALAKSGDPYRVVVDREQKVCDLLGGKKTPHVFLLDGKNVLRYAGAIDDDPNEEKGAAKQEWLKQAIQVVAAGKGTIKVLQTAPEG